MRPVSGQDLRQTPLYGEIEAFFREALEPGFGSVSAPSDPRPSPDGRWVAFRGERLDALEGHPLGRICLAASDGSGVRQITFGPNDDDQPRWSPDGRSLTFRSDRAEEGRHQLYAMDVDGIGEARPLPTVDGVAEQHAWSPDGTRLLVVVAGTEAEQSDAVGSGTVGGDGDLPAWIPLVESSDRVEESRRRLFVLGMASEALTPAARPDLNVWEAAWCGPDRIAAIVSDQPGESAWYGSRLVIIDPALSTDRTLLETDVQLGWVCAPADGTRLAVVEALCSDRLVVAGDLLLLDPDGGDPRRVDAGDVDVAWPVWRDDGSLVAAGIRWLDSVVLDVDVDAAVAKERWATSEAIGALFIQAGPLGSDVVVPLQSLDRPPELVVVGDGELRTVAATRHAGTDRIRSAIGSRQQLTYPAPDGTSIEAVLTVPRSEPPFPLILHVHGGPIWGYQDFWPSVLMAVLANRGYAFLQPNPRGSWGRGRGFASAVVGDMGGADALDLLAGLDHVIETGMADPERIGVMGGSYGGFMAALLPSLDRRFRAAVSLSPVTDWYSERFESNLGAWSVGFLGGEPHDRREHYHERSPVLLADRNRTPTLLTAGFHDRATPTGQAVELHRALREQEVPTDVVLYPQEGHGVRNFPTVIDLTTRIVAWFERFLPTERASS